MFDPLFLGCLSASPHLMPCQLQHWLRWKATKAIGLCRNFKVGFQEVCKNSKTIRHARRCFGTPLLMCIQTYPRRSSSNVCPHLVIWVPLYWNASASPAGKCNQAKQAHLWAMSSGFRTWYCRRKLLLGTACFLRSFGSVFSLTGLPYSGT